MYNIEILFLKSFLCYLHFVAANVNTSASTWGEKKKKIDPFVKSRM